MQPVIKVENLSKRYIISHQERESYSTIRDEISKAAKKLAGKLTGNGYKKPAKEEFWALRDVGFEINPGDKVGLIGRNGAGKSTLLKIMSRITDPTSGRITISGRVASLLEVGTGFHTELTGRENIYMNGAILGMSRAEIKRKFDEIVAFSGVEKFLDTPVKRYSSGMSVRLAFAVAAHLEPEILLVDEVLAVGDAEFQRKCIGKMGEVSREGRTLIFVSHNLAAVASLCDRGVLLDGGKLAFAGEMEETLAVYRKNILAAGSSARVNTPPEGPMAIRAIHLTDAGGTPVETVRSGDSMSVVFDYELMGGAAGKTSLHFIVTNEDQTRVFCLSSEHAGDGLTAKPGHGKIHLNIPRLPLAPGTYQYSFTCYFEGKRTHKLLNFGELVVTEGNFYKTGATPHKKLGLMLVEHSWNEAGKGTAE